MSRILVTCVVVAVGATIAAIGSTPPPPCGMRPPAYGGGSARVVEGAAGQGKLSERYFVVLPTGYDHEPTRRYPVLYLLHGAESTADEWLVCTRLLELSEASRVLIILPQGSPTGWWIDWHNGAELREQAIIRTLIPHIDATFRSLDQREHRAIGGLSMGGYGALVQAARHSELFTAAASLSGVLRISDPTLPWGAVAYATATAITPGAFADPLTGRGWRRDHDPASLAERLRHLTLFLSAGSGVPCGAEEALRFAEPDPTQPVLESVVRTEGDHVHNELVTRGIAHTYERYPCGAHTFFTFQRGLVDAWPHLMRAIGAAG
jgi:diacylglycerol O-acyltransferase / trehalose O-mycolyltransferase